ncbi:phage major capsid protein [Cytobacillus oceanisediminis]|uniref:phage major capsid protein n=1 Tax=Cytobacillus oceanisediminis TaxID=665099 RepID=UPI001FB49CED|nr:phage major capsid protein [Cytobacillus oceanisediminis]UOE58092.1 phage major capsid protein [Cytobacillus oceanisediminis]
MEKSIELHEKYTKMMGYAGKIPASQRVTVSEALTSADANILLPKVISTVVLEAAEPLTLVSNLFQKVTLNEGRSMEFIHFGAIRAFEIAEGQEYPNQSLDITGGGIGSVDVKVKKYGLRISITDEMISDSQWDVIGLHLRAAGRALAAKKEEICFTEFRKAGHVVFDGDMFTAGQDGYPTGRGFNGEYNGTLAAEDIIDMAVSIMSAGFQPTTIIMHPLCWSLFAKNAALEGTSIAAFGQGSSNFDPRNYNTSNALGLEVIFSPFVPFDQEAKKFDFYLVDKNNVGVMLVKDEVSTEQFDDPSRDIQTLKLRERYGVGVLNGGLAISVAKNIKFAKTYPAPERKFADMALPSDMQGAAAKQHDEI